MKLLVVRHGRQLGNDDPEQAGAFLTAAEKIAGLPDDGRALARAR